MSIYQWMALFGLPSMIMAAYAYLTAKVHDIRKRTEATQSGIQAMLRAQMIAEYNKAIDKGFAPIYAKESFENIWMNYHALGANGVMDDIHEKYKSMPTEIKA